MLDHGGSLYMLTPSDLTADFIRRLQMFVLRAKVQFAVNEPLIPVGILGAVEAVPDAIPGFQVGAETARTVCLLPPEQISRLPAAREVDMKFWRLADIVHGIPQIYPATRELFIPQHINLDLVDGVSFKKGCYPGQEIVARVKYRGRAKQRLLAGIAAGNACPQPGDALFHAGAEHRKAGAVVDAVAIEPGKFCLSAAAPAPLTGELAVGAGATLAILKLPYTTKQPAAD